MRLQPVSYFVPAFNAAGTLCEAVISILNGNLEADDEVIIVDDQSTDTTQKVIVSLTSTTARIRSFRHDQNLGAAAARNTAIQHARYDLLFCLDADNILLPGSVAPLRHHLLEQEADAVAFQFTNFFRGSTSRVTHQWQYKAGLITLADYLAGPIVPGASGNYLFTRQSWIHAGGYPVFAGALDTWGFGLRQLATGTKMFVLPGGGYLHRYGHESYWLRESRKGTFASTANRLLEPYLHLLHESDARYVTGEGRDFWFANLKKRPLRVRGQLPGQTGRMLLSPSYRVKRFLGHLLTSLLGREE